MALTLEKTDAIVKLEQYAKGMEEISTRTEE